ncbi:MAG: alpha/beta fold hydrolase [Saprospiraceae bacterium]
MTIRINNIDYFYKDTGKGEPIVFIHGNPDSADSWDDLIPLLSQQYRCIAPDLPGFGRSDIATDFDFTLDGCQNWLASFLEAIDITEPIHLIVHDVGTFYGVTWAVKNQTQVKSICITNTLFFSDYKWHFWGRVWRTPIIGELSQLLMNKKLYKNALRKSSPKLSDAYLEKGYALIGLKMQKTVLKLYRAMSPSVFKGWEDEYLALTKIKPVLVIWGDNDPYIPLSLGYAERMANGQTVYRVASGGHWVAAEEPELFANYWLDFANNIAL